MKTVAEICLYGTTSVGAGYLISVQNEKPFGQHEPRQGRSFTEAVYMAAGELAARGVLEGQIVIYAPGGLKRSLVSLSSIPNFGSLKWETAPQHVISVDTLMSRANAGQPLQQ